MQISSAKWIGFLTDESVGEGKRDSAFGACGGVTNLFMEEFPNRPALVGGILAADCQAVLTEFFGKLRRGGGAAEGR